MQHISPYNSLKTYEVQNWTGWKDMYHIYYKGCSKWILGHFQYQNVHTHFSTIKVIRGNKYKGSVTLWNVLNPCWTPCNRPWKCGNAVLLDILFQGKKSHTHFLCERKTFHIYPESLCKRDLEMSLRNFDYLSGFTIV